MAPRVALITGAGGHHLGCFGASIAKLVTFAQMAFSQRQPVLLHGALHLNAGGSTLSFEL